MQLGLWSSLLVEILSSCCSAVCNPVLLHGAVGTPCIGECCERAAFSCSTLQQDWLGGSADALPSGRRFLPLLGSGSPAPVLIPGLAAGQGSSVLLRGTTRELSAWWLCACVPVGQQR